MTTPGPWHEVELSDGALHRWREFPETASVPFEVQMKVGDLWHPLPMTLQRAFALGYHARRELVATLVAQEQHGGGHGPPPGEIDPPRCEQPVRVGDERRPCKLPPGHDGPCKAKVRMVS